MEETTKIIQDYYNATVAEEWNRIDGKPEFLLTCRMLDRYIKPGQKVLDIGGGPGRYALYLAGKGCDVTLFDLSPENTKFAALQAREQSLSLQTITGDACYADKLTHEKYDHILLMGPMYHLLEETMRIEAVNAALNLLKPGGIIYVSFLSIFAGMIYYMKQEPNFAIDPEGDEYIKHLVAGKNYSGDAFTKAFFIDIKAVLPFMSQFPLEKMHYFGQEGITGPAERNILAHGPDVLKIWLDISEKLWEREEFLSHSEHLMYVGRKNT